MTAALSHIDSQTIGYALAAVGLPLVAALINLLLPAKSGRVSGWISAVAILLSAVLAAIVFGRVWNFKQLQEQQLWFMVGSTPVYAGVLLNNLSVFMLLLVTVIALPVHIYSTGYIKSAEQNRYFTYLSFFCFSMMALVLVDSTLLFYAFWELVGFSSYLLIGFWFTKDSAVQANKKAFIMNRIGDIGLLTAIIILFAQFHTFDLVRLFGEKGLVRFAIIDHGFWVSPVGSLPQVWQYVAFVGILLAVAAKSAQFPLHTWLPDAMEGPTSVSALIHAATMVAAGVFLLGRVYPLFNIYELNTLAIIGSFTALLAATIALTQNDLKRILAYSTISQLGYMIAAMGINAYASSLFHLATHAFFKCLLFLCAGVIIHEVQHIKDEHQLDIDPQNILYMGGLRKKMPITFIATLVGCLALVGLPLTSGYLSKDGILIQVFEWAENKPGVYMIIPVSIMLTSCLTAFYVARLIFKVFFGEFRLKEILPDIHLHIGDGGFVFSIPLIFLSICSLFPLFSFNPLVYEHAWLFEGFSPSQMMARANNYHTIIPVLINILCVFVAYWAYAVYIQQRKLVFTQNSLWFRLSYNQWYIDTFYRKAVVGGVLWLSRTLFAFDKQVIDGGIDKLQALTRSLAGLAAWTDRYIVDGVLHLTAWTVRVIGGSVRSFQNGRVQYYLFSMLAVVLAVLVFKLLI
ncbi:NADH-quinone oxidoreductase subunit L [Mucilaginibacter daejeonensis]|uniref:NADH-quinone oxidoreductase subunit 5 family protein n=1 Tax=Mucilaginibacter daejeonensis TaxID=398049 RepID=UPI001D1720C5|nr:NADH-quinone oxidoreductase subunit L [Mucilaginibacter daejeonensis]UEG54755.1 NADH-quinone oxidoreductase subunit L [Mucilaginibacter daejeonensis]